MPLRPPAQPRTTMPADSIPDTALGLSASEIALLRHHSNIALHSRGGSSTSAAASQAASSQGRLLLDPSSLAALSAHFDGVMGRIRERWEWLSHQTTLATQTQYDRSGNAIALADAEIARFRAILAEIDELENEFEKVRHIGEIVKGFRSRVEGLERRI
ncbi:hypothetical protein M011DRAFT_520105 [Sporormia fimetaria CBS 119925]|uniref:Biogenesis of lysosome-related organelles complex 1 subunit CNL1 n=1 Tax=Sporormia fimetaria CBS 119925 TaxID=1340428 RepID=A0A6A6V712_9PLEO|nr:hypothetical protein M011DRAFT_520105 [Sporormia fimetaria CBS 119925]